MMGDVGMKEKGRPAGADKKRILLLGFFFLLWCGFSYVLSVVNLFARLFDK